MASSFARDVQGLFRESDRQAMEAWFDLSDHAQVKEHANDILARLEDGDMPCDAPWPAERIAVFRTWLAEGAQP